MREWIKPAAIGFGGAVVAILVLSTLYGAVLTWQRAQQGAAAFAYIQDAIKAQQQAKPQPAPHTP